MINSDKHISNMRILQESGLNYSSAGKHGVCIRTNIGNVMFYPTQDKYVYKNKSYFGDALRVIDFVKEIQQANWQ